MAWTLDTETGVLEISGTGDMANWLYGSLVPWYSYTMDIKVVTLLEGVTTIGDNAFISCNSLVSVEIPKSINSIGNSAFEGCLNLESINVDIENTHYMSKNGILYNKNQTSILCYPAGKSNPEFTIPESVTSIGYDIFEDCISLESISVDRGNNSYMSKDGVLYNKNQTSIIRYPAGKTDTNFTISNNITSIENHAFYNCNSIKSIEIPNSVTYIGKYAFFYCTSLESIEIPESVTSIGELAFYNCSSLKSVEILEGITSIEQYTFYYCINLESVKIPESVTSIGNSAFGNCSSLVSIKIPKSVATIGNSAFGSCKILDKIYFNSTTPPTIGNYIAFHNVKSGARAIVPASWGIAEGSKWNGLIVEYYGNELPDVCEYCEQEECVCEPFEEVIADWLGENGFAENIPANIKTVQDLKDELETIVTILYENGSQVPDDKPLGTGMIIKNGAEEITVVIANDLDGDGYTDINDAHRFLEHLVGNNLLDGAFREAAKGYVDNGKSAIRNLRTFLNATLGAGT